MAGVSSGDVEQGLELIQSRLRLGGGPSQPILAGRPGGDDPELVQVLRDEAKDFAPLSQYRHGVDGRSVHRVVGLGGSGQDVGVEQDGHSPRPS
jgi:hypothetical protein